MAVAYQPAPQTDSTAELSLLFAQHHQRILRVAYRITGSMADAEDVAQAVFLRRVGRSHQPLANPAGYLYRAAINGALDLLRQRKSSPTGPIDSAANVSDAAPSPEAEVTRKELGAWLRGALSTLSPRSAEMFALRYLDGCTNSEIAVLLNTSQPLVAVTLHHARSKLKKQLQDYERGK